MKLRSLLISGILCTALTGICGGEARWIETTHDFGTFDESMGKVTCTMKFINIGDGDMIIQSVRPTCGCTAANYTRSSIAPGDTANISLAYNPIGRPGRFSKDVVVITDVEPKRTIITIKGNVIGSPNTVQSKYPHGTGALKFNSLTIPFGELRKGKTKTVFIDAYNQSKDTLTLGWSDMPKNISVASIPDTILPGSIATITVTYNSNKKDDWGISKDNFIINVKSENSGRITTEKVDVVAIITEDFSNLNEKEIKNAPILKIAEPSADFGVITGSSPVSRNITIENMGKKPLILRKIYTLDDGITVYTSTDVIKSHKSSIITISADPTKIEGNILNAKINIIANDPQAPRSTVRAVGEIKR